MMHNIMKLDEEHRLVLPSYVIITKPYYPGLKGFQCLICHSNPSWNASDVSNRYCVRCDIFHDDIELYLREKAAKTM